MALTDSSANEIGDTTMEIKQEKEEGKGGGDVTVGEVGEVEAQTTRDEEPEKGGRYSRLFRP